ncbi:MAG TPA: HNH endonuclease domain-containing protein [Paludibacteraceae bacterium]|nr:HNH endonuclease domain-containing protein [Paludibacteraceae bacterium]
MPLPLDHNLDIRPLSQIFKEKTTAYKYYWFASILEIIIKEGRWRISFWEIIVGMIAEAWYPIHYFRLSFGVSESLYKQVIALQKELNIPIDAQKNEIKKQIINNLENLQIKSILRVFTLNVPFRFLSPWIRYTTDADVSIQSKIYANNCLYAIDGEHIDVNPAWQQYLMEHYAILREFTFWNLTIFLQKRNPNVPDIPSKLIKPIQRDSLTKQHHFWDTYIDIVGSVKCIYTGKILHKKEYDLDHFIPWSYVCHNLLWNLLPADSSINSSKSNNLPSLDAYLRPFAQMHHNALKELYPRNPSNKLLEDYLILHDSISELVGYTDEDFFRVYQKTFAPMSQIAANMGFSYWQNPLAK